MAPQRRGELLSTVQQNKYLVITDLGGPATETAPGFTGFGDNRPNRRDKQRRAGNVCHSPTELVRELR
jgi:hypothetical protein